jgi:uncharacterized protein DUF397
VGISAPENRPEMPSNANLHWIKSSLSFKNTLCVELAILPGGRVAMRDSKDPSGPVLQFTLGEWHAFLGGVQNGEFDHFGR